MIQNRRKFSKMRGKVTEAQKICTLAPILVFVLALFAMLSIFSIQAFADEEEFADLQASSTSYNTMYRLYNKYTGEHFYTASSSEKSNLVKVGWSDEGTGWYAPKSSNTPVFRLYNKYVTGGDHHYTTNTSERDSLKKAGWSYEGVGWYSDDSKSVPLYRQYNPYAKTGTHNYTTSSDENKNLVNAGWKEEGVGWYGCKSTNSKPYKSTIDYYKAIESGSKSVKYKYDTKIANSFYYDLKDINSDGTNELFVFGKDSSNAMYVVALYTVSSGNVKNIFDNLYNLSEITCSVYSDNSWILGRLLPANPGNIYKLSKSGIALSIANTVVGENLDKIAVAHGGYMKFSYKNLNNY